MDQGKVIQWCQALLARTNTHVEGIEDIIQVNVLTKLLSCISGRKVPTIIPNPKLRIEHVQNLNVAIAFARDVLQLSKLNIIGEDLMNRDKESTLKCGWSLLWLLYKNYANHEEEAQSIPVLDWARSMSSMKIPSVSSLRDGQAFLLIIAKLCGDENILDGSVAFKDTLKVAIDLAATRLEITQAPPIQELASGSTSSLILFLTMLHNVHFIREAKNHFQEDSSKKTNEIQSLKSANDQLEVSNKRMMEDIHVMQERVKTEMLEETRNNLREECKILKASLVALRSENEQLRLKREQIAQTEAMKWGRLKTKLQMHVCLLKENMERLQDSFPFDLEAADIKYTKDKIAMQLDYCSPLEDNLCGEMHIIM